jgi:site-specific DNA-methyltransferase (adenine-specific)
MIDLRLGDCIDVLKTLKDNSVDSIVTDPPYHLTSIVKRFGKEGSAPAQYGTDGAFARASKGFMGKEWDGGDIAFRTDVWSECLRVLKPGGHLLSFGGSRTYHRMAVAIEDAGFEIRDQIMWVYGSGFPKSHNIGKAIDKIQGNERELVGVKENKINLNATKEGDKSFYENAWNNKEYIDLEVTKGTTEWEGWGTALKPSHEPICMARKPLSEKTIAENVLKHGTGGINIDGSRIPFDMTDTNPATNPLYRQENEYKMPEKGQESNGSVSFTSSKNEISQEGRFPANIMFDEEAGKILDEQSGTLKSGKMKSTHTRHTDGSPNGIYGKFNPNHPIGETYGDTGGASRFFYSPKVSKKERNAGLEDMEEKESVLPGRNTFDENGNRLRVDGSIIPPLVSKNHHPTVKPIALMEYLITLVTPKGGIVLEPFMGSGSTGIAAKNLGMSFIGIEREEEYFEIAKQRIKGNE